MKYYIMIIGLVMIIIPSCSSDEELPGCTDPSAENYNPNATVQSNCSYLSDVFVGAYDSTISDCSRDQELFENIQIIIQADNDEPNEVVLALSGLYSGTLLFESVISSTNQISFNTSYSVVSPTAASAFTYDGRAYLLPQFSLRGDLVNTNDTLTGQLTLSAVDTDDSDRQIFSSRCLYTLTRR